MSTADPLTPPQPPPDSSRVELGERSWMHRDHLQFQFSRSGGPGGQHVNKVSTRAELRVRVQDVRDLEDDARHRLRKLAGQRLTNNDEIIIVCAASRSQHRNREIAVERLADLVRRAEHRPKIRRKRKPTRAMIERRLEKKRQTGEKKQRRQWRGE